MRTRTPISTISYNSESFLKHKLDDLVRLNHVDFYYFIKHQAEADEKKEHIHLYLMPSQPIDTQVLREQFNEYVKDNEMPLKCMTFRKSNSFADAYLYDIHDETYLQYKQLEKKFHYTFSDVISSDDDFLLDMVHQIDWAKIKRGSPAVVIRDAILSGVSWTDLVDSGKVPAQQFSGWHKMYEVIYSKYITVNPLTGEIGSFVPLPTDMDAPAYVDEYNYTLFDNMN